MRDRTGNALRDALTAIKAIQGIVSLLGFSFSRFEREENLRWALEWQMNILGMALRRIDDADKSIRNDVPEIGQAIATQTAISKRYDDIDNQVIWATVVEDLDPLRKAIRALLKDSGQPIP